MPWQVLLIVALVCVAFVLAVVARTGLRAWRLIRHAAAVSRRITPLVDGLTRRGDEIAVAADRLSTDAEQLDESLRRMRRSLARLQVVVTAFNNALRPYLLVSGWLSGEREWSGLDG